LRFTTFCGKLSCELQPTLEVVIVRFLDSAPEWLEPFVLDLSDLDVLPDLDPGLLVWDPDLAPVS
jgi:hypothetical protein